jgi:hypothetical protein
MQMLDAFSNPGPSFSIVWEHFKTRISGQPTEALPSSAAEEIQRIDIQSIASNLLLKNNPSNGLQEDSLIDRPCETEKAEKEAKLKDEFATFQETCSSISQLVGEIRKNSSSLYEKAKSAVPHCGHLDFKAQTCLEEELADWQKAHSAFEESVSLCRSYTDQINLLKEQADLFEKEADKIAVNRIILAELPAIREDLELLLSSIKTVEEWVQELRGRKEEANTEKFVNTVLAKRQANIHNTMAEYYSLKEEAEVHQQDLSNQLIHLEASTKAYVELQLKSPPLPVGQPPKEVVEYQETTIIEQKDTDFIFNHPKIKSEPTDDPKEEKNTYLVPKNPKPLVEFGSLTIPAEEERLAAAKRETEAVRLALYKCRKDTGKLTVYLKKLETIPNATEEIADCQRLLESFKTLKALATTNGINNFNMAD